jgi:hypothetical protein
LHGSRFNGTILGLNAQNFKPKTEAFGRARSSDFLWPDFFSREPLPALARAAITLATKLEKSGSESFFEFSPC